MLSVANFLPPWLERQLPALGSLAAAVHQKTAAAVLLGSWGFLPCLASPSCPGQYCSGLWLSQCHCWCHNTSSHCPATWTVPLRQVALRFCSHCCTQAVARPSHSADANRLAFNVAMTRLLSVPCQCRCQPRWALAGALVALLGSQAPAAAAYEPESLAQSSLQVRLTDFEAAVTVALVSRIQVNFKISALCVTASPSLAVPVHLTYQLTQHLPTPGFLVQSCPASFEVGGTPTSVGGNRSPPPQNVEISSLSLGHYTWPIFFLHHI